MWLHKNKAATFIWCNKSIDCDTWLPNNHNFGGLFFGKPYVMTEVQYVKIIESLDRMHQGARKVRS